MKEGGGGTRLREEKVERGEGPAGSLEGGEQKEAIDNRVETFERKGLRRRGEGRGGWSGREEGEIRGPECSEGKLGVKRGWEEEESKEVLEKGDEKGVDEIDT